MSDQYCRGVCLTGVSALRELIVSHIIYIFYVIGVQTSEMSHSIIMSFFAANFNFLLRYSSYKSGSDEGKKALNMVLKTLEFMEKGGIHDHVGQVRIVILLFQIEKCLFSFLLSHFF